MVVVASFTALFLDHGYYHGESAMRSFILPDVGEPTALAQEKSGIELHSGLSSKLVRFPTLAFARSTGTRLEKSKKKSTE